MELTQRGIEIRAQLKGILNRPLPAAVKMYLESFDGITNPFPENMKYKSRLKEDLVILRHSLDRYTKSRSRK